ncbi:MAG: replication initiator protein [Microviridae sp.]|nr:MAG: replication initiator protein [Microviridae sp.]
MACFRPITAYKLEHGGVTFNRNERGVLCDVQLPCGKCTGCLKARAQGWAVRCMHEASMHDLNCMVTLTYEKHLEPVNGLDHSHFQAFFKRLRQMLRRSDHQVRLSNPSHPYTRIKFFMSGEYRPGLQGPHYHAIIFGMDFLDKKWFKDNERGDPIYISRKLQDLWGHGFCSIVDVTLDSCAYVARYCLDKVHGQLADFHYMGLTPEYSRMSLRPAIGKEWLEKYHRVTYRDDAVVMDGRRYKPPRYYDKLAKSVCADRLEVVKEDRELFALRPEQKWNATPDRLAVREEVALQKLKLRERDLS